VNPGTTRVRPGAARELFVLEPFLSKGLSAVFSTGVSAGKPISVVGVVGGLSADTNVVISLSEDPNSLWSGEVERCWPAESSVRTSGAGSTEGREKGRRGGSTDISADLSADVEDTAIGIKGGA